MNLDLATLRDRAVIREGPHFAWSAVHVAAVALCIWAWSAGQLLLAVALWPVIAWLHHAALARLHEAAHFLLSRSPARNELWGIAIGTLSLTPLSVYRYVHARHHAHLGDRYDPELWPYNLPETSRTRRLAHAWVELSAAFVVTPARYSWYTLRAWRRHRPRTRRRLLLEWALLLVFGAAVLHTVWQFGWWQQLAVGVLVPGWLTGLGQTLRKFTAHLGLADDSILTRTRTVVYRGRLGRLLSKSESHVELHGIHHRWPDIPFRNLPAAAVAVGTSGEPARWYPNHLAALWEAMQHIGDPRVGKQWIEAGRGAGMQRLARRTARAPRRAGARSVAEAGA